MGSFRDRVAQIAMSPDSGQEAAKHGARVMAFNYAPIEQQREEYQAYADSFRKHHSREPQSMVLSGIESFAYFRIHQIFANTSKKNKNTPKFAFRVGNFNKFNFPLQVPNVFFSYHEKSGEKWSPLY